MRALVVCPGRGSYDRASLGSLRDRATPSVAAADAYRAAHGRPTATALDASDAFRSGLHVAGENASILTFACSMADFDALVDVDVVGVVGNSMGFYTALAVSGALPVPDAVRLVDTMGAYQAGNVVGGQLLYPIAGPDLRRDPERIAVVDAAIAATRAAGHFAGWSIDLGSFAVLGADEAGMTALAANLPADARKDRAFPARLPLHSAFHTALMQETSDRARVDLAGLAFRAPSVPLVDGHGTVHRPWSADPEALRAYTLGAQVTEPFDLRTAVRTALRHCAPDVVVALGPGNSLGGPLVAMLLEEGWRGARTREAFDALEPPALMSLGRR